MLLKNRGWVGVFAVLLVLVVAGAYWSNTGRAIQIQISDGVIDDESAQKIGVTIHNTSQEAIRLVGDTCC